MATSGAGPMTTSTTALKLLSSLLISAIKPGISFLAAFTSFVQGYYTDSNTSGPLPPQWHPVDHQAVTTTWDPRVTSKGKPKNGWITTKLSQVEHGGTGVLARQLCEAAPWQASTSGWQQQQQRSQDHNNKATSVTAAFQPSAGIVSALQPLASSISMQSIWRMWTKCTSPFAPNAPLLNFPPCGICTY